MKVLVVEDNEDSRYLLEKILKGHGYEVTAVANGAEALKQALVQPPDLVVSDILMPRMDGYQLCHEWRRNEQLKNIPFIFYTATYTSDEDERFALSLGANTFIRKPAEPDALVQILEEVLEKARAGRLAPIEVAPLEQPLFLTEYNKRITAKLGQKVADLEQAREKLRYANSVLEAMRGVNQLIVREKDRVKMLQGACEILIKVREYKFAWVGLIEERSKKVLPVAKAGVDKDYLNSLRITWDDSETGKEPIGTAIKTRQPSILNNIPGEPGYQPWREEALELGYNSLAAIPLVCDEKVYGALNIYSSLKDGFGDEEVQLLVAIGGDIAFVLKAIDTEEEHKRAEEELDLRAQLLDNVQDAVNLSDIDGNIIYVNETACTSLGYSREELLKMNLGELDTAGYAHALEWRNQELAKKKHTIFETANLRKDRSAIPVEVHARLIEVGGKKLVLSVDRDITERKQMEAEKREMEQKAQLASRLASVGEMASGIAHEINNPLVGVIGFAQLLMGREDLPDDVREELKVIHDGGQRVASIVKGLLSFARQQKPERTYVDINQIIEISLKLRVYEMQTANIEVITKLNPELPWTMADAGQLQQVFLNIIINAEREMVLAHGKGKFQVKTEKIDDTIRISFKDDGPGISKKNMDRIFNPFFTTREAGQGTGLGLSICHGIITEHNGRIYVESKPGRGATFIVELPVISEEKQLEMAETAEDEAQKVAKARILVVDDEPTNLQYLSRMLTQEGHEVETVDNADDTLKKIEEGRYDLILLDIKMPGISGMELHKRIQKATPSLADRVVFITGDVMGSDTMDFLSRTKASYITKPFDIKQLKKGINRILAKGP